MRIPVKADSSWALKSRPVERALDQPIRWTAAVLSLHPRFPAVSWLRRPENARNSAGVRLANFPAMASGWYSDRALSTVVSPARQDRRRETRVDVMMRVQGELVRPETPILVHDLSR